MLSMLATFRWYSRAVPSLFNWKIAWPCACESTTTVALTSSALVRCVRQFMTCAKAVAAATSRTTTSSAIRDKRTFLCMSFSFVQTVYWKPATHYFIRSGDAAGFLHADRPDWIALPPGGYPDYNKGAIH